ncbi:hypothetical protein H0N95_00685 [Candidatus Micrarchaeota archaeon]|nr:hypothetical protein [Candidatus Micrarchaeota archaeon]
MRFDKFGLIAIIIGALVLAGMMHYVYAWNWATALVALVSGGVLVFGLFMLLIGLMLIFL